MKIILPLVAALALGATPLLAGDDSFGDKGEYVRDEGYPPSESPHLYDRIVARYGHTDHDVKEEFHDGPCKIERRWERDGDFEERIRCRGPRH